jgi:mRNA interferase RelE/StbE
VGSKSKPKYQVEIWAAVRDTDLPELPDEIAAQFNDYIAILKLDPINRLGHPGHDLGRRLAGCQTFDIEVNDYRLIYRIHANNSPKWVEVISFGAHDPAYDRAIDRIEQRRRRR